MKKLVLVCLICFVRFEIFGISAADVTIRQSPTDSVSASGVAEVESIDDGATTRVSPLDVSYEETMSIAPGDHDDDAPQSEYLSKIVDIVQESAAHARDQAKIATNAAAQSRQLVVQMEQLCIASRAEADRVFAGLPVNIQRHEFTTTQIKTLNNIFNTAELIYIAALKLDKVIMPMHACFQLYPDFSPKELNELRHHFVGIKELVHQLTDLLLEVPILPDLFPQSITNQVSRANQVTEVSAKAFSGWYSILGMVSITCGSLKPARQETLANVLYFSSILTPIVDHILNGYRDMEKVSKSQLINMSGNLMNAAGHAMNVLAPRFGSIKAEVDYLTPTTPIMAPPIPIPQSASSVRL